MHRRNFLKRAGGAATATALPASAFAQGASSFPNRAITVQVAFAPGASADLLLRAMADVASKHLGQPIIIDNKTGGAGTASAAAMAATAKPDGYTLSQLPIVVFRLPHMQKMSFDPIKDFSFVIHLSGYVLVVACKADAPFKSWAEMIAYARDNPGKVSYASSGPGGTPHLGMEQIAAHAGVKFTHVPMKGGGESSAAVLGGHVMLQVDSTQLRPLVDGGQLRPLVVWTKDRASFWPDVPTLQEVGIPLVFDSPYGLAGPKGMDPAIVKKLHDAFKLALEDPGPQAILKKFDKVSRYLNSQDYAAYAVQLSQQEKEAVEKLGLGKKD